MLRGLALAASLSSFAWTAPGPVEGWQTPVGEGDALSFPQDPAQTPAVRYASLDRARCEAELTRRGVPFTRASETRGVLAPVRLGGAVNGVTFHSGLTPAQRLTSPYEIFDCRLVLALHDFAGILAKHDVVEVIHLSAYRPPAKGWPDGKVASRHPAALALDAATFVKRDGSRLNVERDFHGRIGTKTCGAGTGPSPATPEAVELRQIICDSADRHLFNVALTPDYNWQHRNHFHLEVTAGVRWFLVH